MSAGARQRLYDSIIAILLGTGAFVLYALTLAPTILAGDGGEFQFVPYLLGVAHPTGYPLYTLMGWAWSRLLPVGDVAYRMNLFSAFWAAMAVGFVYPLGRTLLRQVFSSLSLATNRLLAILTASLFAVTRTLWSQAIIAEVYGLQILLVVLCLYFVLIWGEQRSLLSSAEPRDEARGRRPLLLAALFFGLGLAHHSSTTLLLAPALLVYVWLIDRRVLFDWRRVLLPSLVLALLPLLLYALIPLRAPHTSYLHLPLAEGQELVLYENTAANLVDFALGGPFRGSLDFAVDLGARLSMTLGLLLDEVGWIGILLALAGVAQLIFSRRWAVLALTGLIYLARVGFNLFYTIGDIYVLYIPSYLVVVLWVAVGVGALSSLPKKRRLLSTLVVLPFLILPLWMAVEQIGDVDQSQNRRARNKWEAILAEPLPPDAVLVSNDRNNIMPMWYLQYVDGVRTDLLGLFPQITPDFPTLGTVLDLALATERPIYLIKEMPGVEVKIDVEAEGQLWRVVGPAIQGEPAYESGVDLDGAVRLIGYDRSPHSPSPGGILEVSLYWEALQPLGAEYHSFVHLLDASGQTVAQSDRQPGGVHYPTTLWRPGERLRDDHLLSIPPDTPTGVYRLRAGMYTLETGELVSLGEPIDIGQVGIKTQVQAQPGDIEYPVSAIFGDQIELLGYNTSADGDVLTVAFHWRGAQVPDEDYTVFLHLLDASGATIAQHDSQPLTGAYPTSIWDAGEVVVDAHQLTLPPGLSQGEYRLLVGLYLLESGERLALSGGGDSVELEFDLED